MLVQFIILKQKHKQINLETAVESSLVWIPASNWSYPRTSAWCFSVTRKNELWMWRETVKGYSACIHNYKLFYLSGVRLFSYECDSSCGSMWAFEGNAPLPLTQFLLYSENTQEADSSLYTAPYFLNSNVTDGRSHTEKTARITPTNVARIFSSAYHIRRQIF